VLPYSCFSRNATVCDSTVVIPGYAGSRGRSSM
jgi:hypothetical protein